MNELAEKLKNKKVHIKFLSTFYNCGGVVAANYTVNDIIEGFLQLTTENGTVVLCKLDQIKEIEVLVDIGKDKGGNL